MKQKLTFHKQPSHPIPMPSPICTHPVVVTPHPSPPSHLVRTDNDLSITMGDYHIAVVGHDLTHETPRGWLAGASPELELSHSLPGLWEMNRHEHKASELGGGLRGEERHVGHQKSALHRENILWPMHREHALGRAVHGSVSVMGKPWVG